MSGLMPAQILSYIGEVAVPWIVETFPPTTAFNKFNVPTIWVDKSAKNAYILVAKPSGVADWILIGGAPGALNTITTPDSTVVVPVAGNINFLNGTGMNITGAGNNITFNTVGMGFSWVNVTGLTQTLAPNTGYVCDNGAQITFSLPVTAAFGDVYVIEGFSTGGWKLDQNLGQQITMGSFQTTMSTGTLTSTLASDNLILLCVTANTTFKAIHWTGNILVS